MIGPLALLEFFANVKSRKVEGRPAGPPPQPVHGITHDVAREEAPLEPVLSGEVDEHEPRDDREQPLPRKDQHGDPGDDEHPPEDVADDEHGAAREQRDEPPFAAARGATRPRE